MYNHIPMISLLIVLQITHDVECYPLRDIGVNQGITLEGILPLSIIRSQKLAIMQPHNILLNLLKSDQIPCDGSRMMFYFTPKLKVSATRRSVVSYFVFLH